MHSYHKIYEETNKVKIVPKRKIMNSKYSLESIKKKGQNECLKSNNSQSNRITLKGISDYSLFQIVLLLV